MTESEKETLFDELQRRMEIIAALPPGMKQMKTYLKMGDFLEEIYNKGFNEGLKRGENWFVYNLPKN